MKNNLKDIIHKIDRIHSYPAKFTVDLAEEYILKYSNINDKIYDPFLGSGTTIFAATLNNRYGYGTDINHIAILISNFKILDLEAQDIEKIEFFLNKIKNTSDFAYENLYYYPSIDHWFKNEIVEVLTYLKESILNFSVDNLKISIFLKLIFSSIINNVSKQDSDTRYAAVDKQNVTAEYAIELFIKRLENAIELYRHLKRDAKILDKSKVLLLDSKLCANFLENESIDLVFTSPPYPNTYDYYLYHKHRMNWLEYDVKYSMNMEIGSRREFSSLKRPKEKFDADMLDILRSVERTVKYDGYIILVMGDGKIQGVKYDAKESMELLGKQLGWKLVEYSYTFLDETSRSFQKSYRTKGKKEHILVFQKVKV
jgi:site-specific DNA-methyltransferase (cytosine-N4-specific)